MGVELVHDQDETFCGGVMDIDQVLDTVRPVDPGPLVTDAHLPPAAQRLGDQEQVRHPIARVLWVMAGRLPRRDRQRITGVG